MSRNSIALALTLLSAAAPAFAQSSAAPANVVTPAPAPREGTVGPEQLRDFALPGTRQAAPAEPETPAPVRTAPQPVPSTAAPPPARAATPATRDDRPAAANSAPTERRQESPPEARVVAPQPSLPAATDFPTPAIAEPELVAPSPQPSAPAPGLDAGSEGLPGWWPWALVAVLAGIGLPLALRRRGRVPMVLAGGSADVLERSAPAPAPPAPPPAPAPAPGGELPAGRVTTRLGRPAAPAAVTRAPEEVRPASVPVPPVPGGIVSRRLRGWVELDLAMREIVFTDEEAILRFDLSVANSGAGPALSLALEAIALNAGEQQAADIANFFGRAAASEVAVAELPPMGATMLSHELRMPRAAIRAYEAQGRSVFVPLIAFNASYRTAGQEGRTGSAFLLGKEVPNSPRLAPLVLPEGAGRLLGLGVRQLEEAVRR